LLICESQTRKIAANEVNRKEEEAILFGEIEEQTPLAHTKEDRKQRP